VASELMVLLPQTPEKKKSAELPSGAHVSVTPEIAKISAVSNCIVAFSRSGVPSYAKIAAKWAAQRTAHEQDAEASPYFGLPLHMCVSNYLSLFCKFLLACTIFFTARRQASV